MDRITVSVNATIRSTLGIMIIYGQIHVWGQNCTQLIGKIQLSFFKKLLWIPVNMPNYAVRLETRRLH